jgi:hypothetical protein
MWSGPRTISTVPVRLRELVAGAQPYYDELAAHRLVPG